MALAQEALAWVQSLHAHVEDGSASAVSHPPRAKAALSHQERTRQLEKLLATSKQRVVQHLLQSRSIQKSITQTEIVECAVKAHLALVREQESARRRDGRTLDSRRLSHSSNNNDDEDETRAILWFSESILRHIEEAAGLEPRQPHALQQALNEYSDHSLRTELNAFPVSDFPDLDEALFCRVALAASNSRVTSLEAAALYSRGQQVIAAPRPRENAAVKWDVLKGMLRKKIEILFLASALHEQSSPATDNSTTAVPSPRKSTAATLKSVHQNSSTEGFQELPSREVALLSAQFRQSVSKQGEISDLIVANLSEISQTVPLGTSLEHKSAVAFARRMSVRKLEGVVTKVNYRALMESWRRWDLIVKSHHAEESAVRCLHYFGAYRFLHALQICLNSKMARAMRKLKLNVTSLSSLEFEAAAVELQRILRGCLLRIHKWHQRRKIAATHIQCIARCNIARRRVRHSRQECFFKGHVGKIEKAYTRYRLRQIGKSIQKFKRQKTKACRIQQAYRGHLGRVRVAKMRLQVLREKAATRMQALARKFMANRRVARLFLRIRKVRAAIKIESVFRGRLGRARGAKVKQRYMAARTIQSCWRCLKARKTTLRRRQWLSAIKIQRIARGRMGRRRFRHFDGLRATLRLRRKIAIQKLTGPLLGFITRRTWGPCVRKHVLRRRQARIMIQKTIRKFLACQRISKMRDLQAAKARLVAKVKAEEEARMKRLNKAATTIQRIARGIIGRRKSKEHRERVERIKFLESRIPLYYRLREDYYRSQNLHHRPYILRIQCFLRCRFAWRRVNGLRRQQAANRIQYMSRSRKAICAAKKELAVRRKRRAVLNRAATNIQRTVRGFMGRYEFKKNEKAEIAKWFMNEIKSLGLIGKALQNFRIRKRTLERISRLMIKLQALVRRFLVRCKFRRGHKRLVREREVRRKARRVRACTIIQGFARIIKAKKMVLRRRKIVSEENKLKASIDELEGRLDGIHGNLMTDLLATRAQSTVRGMLGKKAYSKKEAAVGLDAKKQEALRRGTSATKIQAMTRGVQSRVRFKRNLPTLTKERQMRSFCVECEANVAVKRCRQCKDRYCESCFSKLHRKGFRRTHAWDPVAVQQQSVKADKGNKGGSGNRNGGGGPSQASEGLPAPNKKNWEKFYDGAAKAHYWFNATTGEASWVNPFPG